VTGGQRRGVLDVDEDRALAALHLAWGEAYDIGFERQKCGRHPPVRRLHRLTAIPLTR